MLFGGEKFNDALIKCGALQLYKEMDMAQLVLPQVIINMWSIENTCKCI